MTFCSFFIHWSKKTQIHLDGVMSQQKGMGLSYFFTKKTWIWDNLLSFPSNALLLSLLLSHCFSDWNSYDNFTEDDVNLCEK